MRQVADDWRIRAVVEDRKLVDYLLSVSHNVGRFKARFFAAQGFDLRDPESVRAALLAHLASARLSTTIETALGLKFVALGELPSPDGRNPLVRSV